MTDLILDMPRKWQVYDRVRGVALSKERFQFIFKYEHNLGEVLKKRVWTFNERLVVIDRWVENPTEDYLQFMTVWIQIRNIPGNYYTEASIYALGDIIGKVIEIAFDPEKPQSKDYVRVKNGEKLDGPKRRDSSFQDFVEMLQTCEMDVLLSAGDGFTWSGAWRQEFPQANQVSSRFDRRFIGKSMVKEAIRSAWLGTHQVVPLSLMEILGKCRKSLSK
ncbi:uncharacterized protein LOC112087257 [Eutrema salsugineum]|uniref:uncharacterized protein LOC112087257 n=1 Tax=Eutrema salsugineum TaxID=72664 RepID=UPI000CED3ED0|nr:uncharacterized protein LOC112087257 [Eutrema salsugineum]